MKHQRVYVGMEGQSADLDHKSVWKTIEKFEVDDEKDCFGKVLRIFSHIRSLEDAQRKTQRAMKSKK